MPSGIANRNALRKTWLNERFWSHLDTYGKTNVEIRHVFLLGKMKFGDDSAIYEEHKLHGDILRGDFVEGHFNLTLKDHMFLDYVIGNDLIY